ncbi:MAG: bifunctional UDP-N-acetylglucosamine diphosphorylase/glucosamine-1-phosphate N-acetyltransferase GlmU [bacterium]
MSSLTALIMAAGAGTRMRSSLPKVAHPVCGRPMIAWSVAAAREAGADRICAIVSPDRDLSGVLPDGVETVIQPTADGTGGALRAALPVIADSGLVLVLSGDQPLVSAEEIEMLRDESNASGAEAVLLTAELEDPGAYGRVIRSPDGSVEKIVEAKEPGDATPDELAVREVNAGTYLFQAEALADALGEISNDNSQGEYYLPDVLPAMREAGKTIAACVTDAVAVGVNDKIELAAVEAEARKALLEGHMRAGVTVVDPASTWIDADVEIAEDVRIEPGCSIKGATAIKAGALIGPHSTLIDSKVGERSEVRNSHLDSCTIGDGVLVGPFAHIRPGTELADGSKVGSFVEIKNSRIGKGAKVPHLSYVGDADVGEESNLGAATITANYDGKEKHRTKIGRKVRTGVDTTLVAPVEVGDEAYTGAGSVIIEDVPPGALGIGRPEQHNVEGYSDRKREATDREEGNEE